MSGLSERQRLVYADLEKTMHNVNVSADLRRARIFITGGTGFVGYWFVSLLLLMGDALKLDLDITILTRDPEKFLRQEPDIATRVSLLPGDVRDFSFPGGEFSYVVHAATETNARINEEDPHMLKDVIEKGTKRVLDFACGHGVKRFLYVSSGAAYGKQPSDLTHMPETFEGSIDDNNTGASVYAHSKRGAESLVCEVSRRSGIKTPIARLFAFVGAKLPLDEHFAIGNFIRDALGGGSIVVGGDGSSYRSYLYGADLAAWLLRILFDGEDRRVYNVGSDRAMTIKEVAETVASSSRSSCRVEIKGKAISGAVVSRYVPSVDRVKRELGVTESFSLDEAIRRTMQWHSLSEHA